MKKEILWFVFGIIIFLLLIFFYSSNTLTYSVNEVSNTVNKVVKKTEEIIEKKTSEYSPSIEDREKIFFNKVAEAKSQRETKINYFCDPDLSNEYIKNRCIKETQNTKLCDSQIKDYISKNLDKAKKIEANIEEYCSYLKSEEIDFERLVLKEMKDTQLYLRKIKEEYNLLNSKLSNKEERISRIKFLCYEWNFILLEETTPPKEFDNKNFYKNTVKMHCDIGKEYPGVKSFDTMIKSYND